MKNALSSLLIEANGHTGGFTLRWEIYIADAEEHIHRTEEVANLFGIQNAIARYKEEFDLS